MGNSFVTEVRMGGGGGGGRGGRGGVWVWCLTVTNMREPFDK